MIQFPSFTARILILAALFAIRPMKGGHITISSLMARFERLSYAQIINVLVFYEVQLSALSFRHPTS